MPISRKQILFFWISTLKHQTSKYFEANSNLGKASCHGANRHPNRENSNLNFWNRPSPMRCTAWGRILLPSESTRISNWIYPFSEGRVLWSVSWSSHLSAHYARLQVKSSVRSVRTITWKLGEPTDRTNARNLDHHRLHGKLYSFSAVFKHFRHINFENF